MNYLEISKAIYKANTGDGVKFYFMRLFTLLLLLFSFVRLSAQKNIHAQWTNCLQQYVDDDGRVNYSDWAKDTTALDNYIEDLEANPPAEYWSKNDSLAYFINAYNAVTVKLILDNYPLKSIRRLITPWRFKRFTLHNKSVSLNHIEHGILRKMNEPRIHFAINCASASCPKLSNQAYVSHSLTAQLEEATRNFITDPSKNRITANKLSLSRIFQWFARDFGSKRERVAFIQRYSKIPIEVDAAVNFISYDWTLNQ